MWLLNVFFVVHRRIYERWHWPILFSPSAYSLITWPVSLWKSQWTKNCSTVSNLKHVGWTSLISRLRVSCTRVYNSWWRQQCHYVSITMSQRRAWRGFNRWCKSMLSSDGTGDNHPDSSGDARKSGGCQMTHGGDCSMQSTVLNK